MPTAFAFRRATAADAAAIAAVHVASWQATYRGLIDDAVIDAMTIERRTAEWQARLAAPATAPWSLWLAVDGDRVVAFASGGPRRGDWPGFDGELLQLYLHPHAQRRGIGKAMVQRVAADLHARALRGLLVRVLATNPARHFYERLGAELLGESTHEVDGHSYLDRFYGWRDVTALLAAPTK